MKISILLCVAGTVLLTQCGTVSHYGRKPDFSRVSMGMSQQQVIQAMGRPDDMSAQRGLVILRYTHTPWYDHNGADGTGQDYFVRLIDDRVESFGKMGDFDSTKPPEQTINLNIRNQ
jgi:hypothetical protein